MVDLIAPSNASIYLLGTHIPLFDFFLIVGFVARIYGNGFIVSLFCLTLQSSEGIFLVGQAPVLVRMCAIFVTA